MKDCPFCDIFHHKAPEPATLEYPRIGVACFQPLNPHGEGHRLFVPTTHFDNIGCTPASIVATLMSATLEYAWRNSIAEYNIITSVGASATQTVNHVHIHLVPRTPHDGLTLPWGKEAHEHKAKS